MLKKVVAELNKAAKDCVLEEIEVPDDDRLRIDRKHIKKACQTLKNAADLDFKMLTDLTCVDYMGEDERFEVVYQLYSLSKNYRLRLKVRVPEGEKVDTVSDVWAIANALEREVWDMFGVEFAGHPNLTRILLYDQFEGHPLRKDYPLKKHQPIVPLRTPIETEDDPPYNWTPFEKRGRKHPVRKLHVD